jgi:hypothetical protein
MKNSIFVLFPIVFFFVSCQNTSEKTVDEFIDHQISLTEEMRGNDRLAEIPPNDIWIMNTSIQKNLNEMDQWYKDELLQFSNDAYFDNLKSISISIILQQDEIRNVENINLLKYYLKE